MGERDLPVFDRRFFEGTERFTKIGRGSIGGKAAGLAFIKDVLDREITGGSFDGIDVAVPTLVVVGTQVFRQFVTENRLDELPIADLPDDRIAHAFQRAQLPVELVGDLRALIMKVHTPLAVRSSSRLEDALARPFAGVYGTKMIPNNQFDPDQRFRRLVEAIKFVWASTWFREARDYIRATDRRPEEEEMAVIVQEVVGLKRGTRFYPDVSGVARSYNFYPTGTARPEDGVVDLALGLGKTIVDGGVAWSYSPAQPRRTPPFGSLRDYLSSTQTGFWAVNMGPAPAYDPINETEYLVQADLAVAESDEALRYVASTYDGANDRIAPGLGTKGPRVINFAPLLVLQEFPLNNLVRALLAAAESASAAKVEIEFAVTFERALNQPTRARFGFLQVRPMVVSNEEIDVAAADLAGTSVLLASDRVMGNGSLDLQDVLYVRPDTFDPVETPAIAAELEQVNRELVDAGRPYLLIGFGRWGSSHPTLGTPVTWAQISGARAIVETTRPDMNVEPSQGSHFFHNLSSFRVSYFTLHHEGRFRIDWDWLAGQPVVRETARTRLVRTDVPLSVRVDGRTGRGVVTHG